MTVVAGRLQIIGKDGLACVPIPNLLLLRTYVQNCSLFSEMVSNLSENYDVAYFYAIMKSSSHLLIDSRSAPGELTAYLRESACQNVNHL